MGPGPGLGLGPGLLLLLLLRVLGGPADGPHSLRYFTVAVSEPSPGLPKYVVVGSVDDIPFVRYDSETRRVEPTVGWMRGTVDAQYWEDETERVERYQHIDDIDLETLRHRYNKSVGAHTIQTILGCDILEDGRVRGYYQDAYDGSDFLTFDMNTMTFTASDEASQITKRKWEQDGSVTARWKNYVENTCPEWLRKYVSYGRAALARKEPPTVRVSRMATPGTLTLYCRAYGFYPRLITVTWVKDGEIMDQETEWGSIAPNSDGTYHTSASIRIHPGEEDKYQCHVDHASLTKTEIYVWEPESKTFTVMVAVAIAVLGVVTIAAIAAFAFWKLRFVKKGYNTQVPAEDRSQDEVARVIST